MIGNHETNPMKQIAFILSALLFAINASAQGTRADYERAANLQRLTDNKVFKTKVTPHWLPDGTEFWYRNELPGGKEECVLVDAIKGTRQGGYHSPPTELPATESPTKTRSTGESTHINFTNKTKSVVHLFWIDTGGNRREYGTIPPGGHQQQQTFAGHVWLAADSDGKTIAAFTAMADECTAVIEENHHVPTPAPAPAPENKRERIEAKHPQAFIRDFNIHLRNPDIAPTTDGTADDSYEGNFFWSPDGKKLVALRRKKGEEHIVYMIESSPKDQVQPKLISHEYQKPGDKIAISKPHLFDIETKKEIPISDSLFPNPWSIGDVKWSPDSSNFTFLYNQRGHQILRIVSVDANTGAARALVDEVSPTFVDYSGKYFSHWLDDSRELIWMSERDGWNHLYLYDTQTGRVKNQITKGPWVVRGVDKVDEEKRQIWFHAGGIRPEQDPYYLHYCRVNFDGTGLVVLTEGDGTHEVSFSPDRRFFVDSWSRVDQPPVTELRRCDTGALICPLERADWTALLKTGWRAPERFVAKGRDGTTDIYGVIYRPTNFDLQKKYPVIEQIYAGPQGFYVPKSFHSFHMSQEIAELGFIVVQIDGMGTSGRSKQFHDVCWKNLVDGGFPDRILWLKAAAAKDPSMDLSRVGIYGGSAGGQNALAAMLTHGDFYKACVADCGCHDNRMDKIWWNEQWMGWPVGKEYAENSNVTLAHNLRGKLLLTVGELDHNVDPASTMQVVNALIKADKDFELLVIPGADHGCGETPYGKRRRADFFVRNLLGVEPRNR